MTFKLAGTADDAAVLASNCQRGGVLGPPSGVSCYQGWHSLRQEKECLPPLLALQGCRASLDAGHPPWAIPGQVVQRSNALNAKAGPGMPMLLTRHWQPSRMAGASTKTFTKFGMYNLAITIHNEFKHPLRVRLTCISKTLVGSPPRNQDIPCKPRTSCQCAGRGTDAELVLAAWDEIQIKFLY